jgi:hypothetical protein
MLVDENIDDIVIEDENEDDSIKNVFIPVDDIDEENTYSVVETLPELIKPKLREEYIKKQKSKEIIKGHFITTSDKKI